MPVDKILFQRIHRHNCPFHIHCAGYHSPALRNGVNTALVVQTLSQGVSRRQSMRGLYHSPSHAFFSIDSGYLHRYFRIFSPLSRILPSCCKPVAKLFSTEIINHPSHTLSPNPFSPMRFIPSFQSPEPISGSPWLPNFKALSMASVQCSNRCCRLSRDARSLNISPAHQSFNTSSSRKGSPLLQYGRHLRSPRYTPP